MTPLTKAVSRETAKVIGSRPVVLTIAPLGRQPDARLGFRLKGRRQTYILLLSDAYRIAAMQYGQKEKAAKRDARKAGIAWRTARKSFIRANSI